MLRCNCIRKSDTTCPGDLLSEHVTYSLNSNFFFMDTMNRPEHRHSLPGGPQPLYTTPHVAHQYYVQQVQPNPNALYEQWRQTKVSELEDVVRNALVHWVKQLADMIEAKNAALNQGIMDTQSVIASTNFTRLFVESG